MLRCRENDLAVVLAGKYTGYFVKVVKFLGDEYGKDSWEISNPDIEADFPWSQLVCMDSYLQPIRPGCTPVTTETERRITA
jgi:hypothetical protein